MSWTLDISGGGAQSLAALGIARLRLDYLNLADDALALDEVPRASSAAALMEFGDTLKLYHGETCRFVGTVSSSPERGMPGAVKARGHYARNIFWDLSRLPYEQEWHDGAVSTYYKGRVKLGKDVDDARLSVGAAIKDVLDFAIAEGLSFSYEAADLTALSAVPPDSEHVDITCAEAIRILLNWAPSVATEVEYASGTPKIRFIKRASASAVTLDAGDLASLSIAPRPDLRVEGVVLRYEQANDVDGDRWTTVVEDVAGASTGLAVLKQTIELYGMESYSSEQSVDVVVGAGPASATDANWWKQYVPGLSLLTGLTVKDGDTLGAGWSVLLSGSVPEWTGEDTDTVEVTAKASGTLNGVAVADLPIAVSLAITTADTDTYSTLTEATYTPPEDVPTGLATSIYAERSVLHYEGSLVLEDSDPVFSCTPAKVLNIDPGGYAAIDAAIARVSIDVVPGWATTTIAIGPPRHLAVQDYIAMLRATRSRRTSYWSRKEPDTGRGGTVEMGGQTPNQNGAMLGGAGLPSTAGKEAGMVLQLETEGETLKADWGAPTIKWS